MAEGVDAARIDRVETDVATIRSEMGGLKTEMGRVQADVRGLSGILSRIEQGVVRAQEQQDERESRSRTPPVALAAVLVTIMSLLVGGAWMIGSLTASTSAKLIDQQTSISETIRLRDRDIDALNHRIDKLEDRGERGQAARP